ncbi:HdeD family acid-resistance protein [Patescibacteria group bacterium]|nr:HdeD family acid-resistance protein [Patescibacteria group bacterium]MBU1673532.1 HdeD family acid-resistance protein [Patescibacteria group bacterium]MBU1963716.1 HdeD family acid-resistance protein [Patescibacteria group bacterium]
MQDLRKYSTSLITRGCVAILFGIIALAWTGMTVELLVYLFAFFALLAGILSLVGAGMAMKHHEKWWIFLIYGLIDIAIGIIVLVWPGLTLAFLIYLIAIWAIASGTVQLFSAFASGWSDAPKWVLVLGGILSIILGFLIILYPISTTVVLIYFLAIYAIIFGIIMIVVGIQSRKEFKKEDKPIEREEG